MLEVDLSPLRANKGGSLRGEEPRKKKVRPGPRPILPYVGSFFALVAHFFDFFTHLKLSCNFLMFFNDFSSSFGGFGVVWGWILGGFFEDF